MSIEEEREVSRGANQFPSPDMMPASESDLSHAAFQRVHSGMPNADQTTAPNSDSDRPSIPVWMEDGRCREAPAEIFFSSKRKDIARAKRICETCDVIGPCLEFALENRIDHGVWGGKSEKDRRRIQEPDGFLRRWTRKIIG